MAESNSNNLENQPTQELSFEERVMKQFELITTQMVFMQSQITNVLAEQAAMREEIIALRTEMIEPFVHLTRQIRELDARVAKIEERFEDVDYKLDSFIKEQINMKREWCSQQAHQTAR